MKILAFGDTQIGVSTVSLIDQARVLGRIVERAIDERVDIVIHGGDVFEGPVVMPEHLRVFIDATEPLRLARIPLLVLRGNGRHDMATRDVHALDVLRELDCTQIFDRPEWVGIGDVGVCCLPWVKRGYVEADDETAAQMLVRIAGEMQVEARESPLAETVLVAHWAISGSALPTGLPVDEMREPILPLAELQALGYDAIIGAHVHQPQRIDNPELGDTTPTVVVGSPQQLNFGEVGEHGCWLIDVPALAEPDAIPLSGGSSPEEGRPNSSLVARTASGSASAEFIPIESKRFVTVTDRLDLDQIREGDIVRVRYAATAEEERSIDHDRIRQELLDAGASAVKIEPQIERVSRARVSEITGQMSETDALAAWCDANDVQGEERSRLLGRFREWSAA